MLNLCVIVRIGGLVIESYYVYQHVNKINGKQYIGLTKQKPEARWGTDGINYEHSSPHFWCAIEKYGWDNFEHNVLFQNLTKEEACNKEIELIKQYNTQNREYGYNIMEGGTCPSMPKEVREKLSIALQGNTNGKGHPCSEEKKKKISKAQKGSTFTEEHKKRISEAKKGKSTGACSKETRKKISDTHKKNPVLCVELNKVFPSIQECARQLNLYATLICKCCKKKLKSTGGYHFEYYQ